MTASAPSKNAGSAAAHVSASISPEDAALKLLAYCRARDWAGHDPYDALNSRIFAALPFSNLKLPRLLLTQALKRSPVDFRGVLRTPPTQNPKALALFIMALLKLRRPGVAHDSEISYLTGRLEALRSPDQRYWSWGYSFAWQGRNDYVPRGEANLVCTTFVAAALLDLYEERQEPRYLEMAASAAQYILNELFWTAGAVASFSYPRASTRSLVHNANFLAAALLLRVYKETGEDDLRSAALKVSHYSVSRQQPDGSWYYGELPTQQWIDNFHTGYNLRGLQSIGQAAGTDEFDVAIRRGLDFYRDHFFCDDGAPKYFHDRKYPFDIHSAAESLLTLCAFANSDSTNAALAQRVFEWTMARLWNPVGYFYYQERQWRTVKTSYMRWAQAWMLLALATLVEKETQALPAPHNGDSCHGHQLREDAINIA